MTAARVKAPQGQAAGRDIRNTRIVEVNGNHLDLTNHQGPITIVQVNNTPVRVSAPRSRAAKIAFVLQHCEDNKRRLELVLDFAQREFSTRLLKDLSDNALKRVYLYVHKIISNERV